MRRGVQLVLWFRGLRSSSSSQAHLTASAPFRVRAPGPYPASYPRRPAGGASHSCPGFPLPFGCRHSLLGHQIPAGGLGLPHGRLTGQHSDRTPTGLPRFARTSYDRGGCLLYPEDGGALPELSGLPNRRLPLPSGQSLSSATASHRRRCGRRVKTSPPAPVEE